MNYDEVVLGRRSIRGYLDKPVPRELIEEVIASQPTDYLPTDGWQEKASKALAKMLPPAAAELLDEFLAVKREKGDGQIRQLDPIPDERRLGF